MKEKVLQRIQKALSAATNPVLFWSSGKDSMLLLWLIREIRNIPCVWFRHDLLPTQKEFAEKVIMDLDLTVFSYPPMQRFVLPGMTFISDQSIKGVAFPVLVDQVHSDRCALELDKQRLSFFEFGWDTVLTGWKHSDSHPLIPKMNLEGFRVGDVMFHAPLHDLTDEDVWTLIRELNVPVDEKRYAGNDLYNPDVIHACVNCMTPNQETVFCPREQAQISAHVWDYKGEVAKFRARFA
jgi:3'-phosphoadenosine 5'-phosphosulfate sulfotransferase (PAPS reductase)/FAD synthetase